MDILFFKASHAPLSATAVLRKVHVQTFSGFKYWYSSIMKKYISKNYEIKDL